MNKKNQDTLVDAAMKDPQRTAALLLVGINESLKVIATQMVRSNEDRDRFYREVLGVLTQAKAAPPKQCWKTKRGPQPVVGEAFVYRCVLELGHDGKCTDGERMEWN